MPVYEAICKKCLKLHDYFQPVSNYLKTPECCGELTSKVILSAPVARGDEIHWYESPTTGQTIKTRSDRKRDMEASNCRDYEGLETETYEAKRRTAYQEEKEDKQMESWIVDSLNKMPEPKKNALLGVE